MHWRRKWQPTPVFLPGESQGREAWWAAISGVAQSRTRLKLHSSSSRNVLGFLCSSVQLLSHVCLFRPHGLQHIRLPVYHQLPELTQTHVHRVSDAIQPSHPLSFPSPPASVGIPSPPLALFIVMLPKTHLTSHSRLSCSRWVITSLWLSGPLSSFFVYIQEKAMATHSSTLALKIPWMEEPCRL